MDFDFLQLLGWSGRDLLRPNGTYVGVRAEPDDLRSEAEDDQESDDSHDEENSLSGLDESDDMPIGVDLDDFLPDSENESGSATLTEGSRRWMTVEGKTYFKASVISSLCSNRSRKVTMRTLRARGVTLEDLSRKSRVHKSDTHLDDKDLIKGGDLAATLVRSGPSGIALAVFEIKGFRNNKEKTLLATIPAASLEEPTGAPTVVGQVIDMCGAISEETGGEAWEWTGKYLSSQVSARSDLVTRWSLIFDVPGHMVFPVAPKVVDSEDPDARYSVTWSLEHEQLMP
ncbi:hypothetical protein PQX77_008914 [Marasmius sp. AFHP31]|nr:hypothetical protein PQX77_008914 [Marasmius sp. AFHP31]